VQVQRVGPDLVFGRLWATLQLGTILQRALQGRRYEFDVERRKCQLSLLNFFVLPSRRHIRGGFGKAQNPPARSRGAPNQFKK
jgi:hypothetical protein